jgi:hypothetical protein
MRGLVLFSKTLRVHGQRRLIGFPALFVLMLGQQVGPEILLNYGRLWLDFERLAIHALSIAVLLERVVDGAQVVQDIGYFWGPASAIAW